MTGRDAARGRSVRGSRSAAPRTDLTSPRAVAVETVRRVTDEDAYSNRLLPVLLERSGLDARDRALAVELGMGTLRRLPAVDHSLSRLLRRPLPEAPQRARAVLRVGAYQLLFTRIPDHAAVSQTVALAEPGERGFVNAVLRRLVREGVRWPEDAGDQAVAVRTGVAPWIVSELRRLVGDDVEEAAVGLAQPAPLTVRANPCRSSVDSVRTALRDAGHDPQPGLVHPSSLRLQRGDPAGLPGFSEGWFAVQDEASSWVVDVLDPRPGDVVLDACAGPGGKAADIACRAGRAVAGDVSEPRARLVRDVAERLGVAARVVVHDASVPGLLPRFDRVLVDAPCSGIGAARRRPELLWRPRRTQLSELARLQVRLLVGAASVLRPGGTLVYSVCTFPRAETEAVCDALVARVPELRPDPFPRPGGETGTRARLWPHRHGTDAMFVARFVLAR